MTTKVVARIPGGTRFVLEGWDRGAAAMLAFLRARGFTEVLEVKEEEPEQFVTAEGTFLIPDK